MNAFDRAWLLMCALIVGTIASGEDGLQVVGLVGFVFLAVINTVLHFLPKRRQSSDGGGWSR